MIRFLIYSFACICVVGILTSASIGKSESELSKLMRTMANDMKAFRVQVQQGKLYTKWGKKYDRILTATPSAASKKGEHFNEYSQMFLKQVERTKAVKTPDLLKPEYNALVQTCIHCHESYCPGPITMLKKLKLP